MSRFGYSAETEQLLEDMWLALRPRSVLPTAPVESGPVLEDPDGLNCQISASWG